jgi:hypothetical protein
LDAWKNWSKNMTELGPCKVWTGAKAGNGYGVTNMNGRQVYVHRKAWAEKNGPIPPGLVISHKCDNPACHNPDHLTACTQAENLADMRRKGRGASGEKHGSKTRPERTARGERVASSKLSPEQITAIRTEYIPGKPGHRNPCSLSGLAAKYGVAFQTISKIVNRKSWRHE